VTGDLGTKAAERWTLCARAQVAPTGPLAGRLNGVQRPQLRSPLARAVVPVAGGLVFFALLFGIIWLAALWISGNGERVTNLGDRTFQVGNVERVAAQIVEGGPVLYPDLRDPNGTRAIVLDHQGDIPALGWRVFYAYPADRDANCLAEQIEGTRTFVDCDGRRLDVESLARPVDARPLVENERTLYIDLRTPTTTSLPG
jgi:hypothetical protein